MTSLVFAVPLLWVAAMLQGTVINRLGDVSARPNLTLLLVLAWTMIPGRAFEGAVWALVGGFALDLYSGGPFGAHMLAMLVTAMVVGVVEGRFWGLNLLLTLVAAIVGTALFYLIYLIILLVSGYPVNLVDAVFGLVVPATGLHMLLIIPLYVLARRVNRVLSPAQVETQQ